MSLQTRLSALAQAIGGDIKALNAKVPEVDVSPGGPSPRSSQLLWVDSDEPTISAGLVPPGGSIGQMLVKNSASDYDASWGLGQPVPSARMSWTGNTSLVTNTWYAVGTTNAGVGASIGAAGAATSQWHSGDATQLDLANGRLIARTKGLYHMIAQCSFGVSATAGARGLGIRLNAGTVSAIAGQLIGGNGAATNSLTMFCSGLWPMIVGDYAEIDFFQNIGTGLSLLNYTFSFVYLGPTP